jgi:hypothetical protein
MKSGKVFFLVNAKSKLDLLNKDLILLFGTNEYLRSKVLATYPDLICEDEDILTVRSGDAVMEFYYGAEEVIDKFVLVDVVYLDEPERALFKVCKKNNWHFYDIEAESYIEF